MPGLTINQTVETTVSSLDVETRPLNDPTGAATLKIGRHTFQLVVEDDQGNRSLAARADVEVIQTTALPFGGVLPVGVVLPTRLPISLPILPPAVIDRLRPQASTDAGTKRPAKKRPAKKAKPGEKAKPRKKPAPKR